MRCAQPQSEFKRSNGDEIEEEKNIQSNLAKFIPNTSLMLSSVTFNVNEEITVQ
jgi:hypothetical protein